MISALAHLADVNMIGQPFKPYGLELGSFDPARIRRPSSPVLLPDNTARLIGQTVLTWGSFEFLFDDLLTAILAANNTEMVSEWQRKLNFRKRHALMKKEARKLFGRRVWLHWYLSRVLKDALPLHRDRNLLVHGRLSVRVETGEVDDGELPGTAILCCAGTHRGKPIVREFSFDDIETLFYDMAHLAGRLKAFLANAAILEISSRDRSFLQAFLDKDYRSSATSPIQLHLP